MEIKKVIGLVISLFTLQQAVAIEPTKKLKHEQWIDAGIRANVGGKGLFNQSTLTSNNVNYKFPLGYSGGLKVGYNYDKVSLCVEGLYSAFDQKLTGKSDQGFDFERQLKFSYYDFPVLLRIKDGKWKYIELGVMFSSLQSAKSNFTTSTEPGSGVVNLKSTLPSNSTSAIFGWGSDFVGTNGMMMSLGLRLAYGFTDIMKANKASQQNFPYPLFPGDKSNSESSVYKITNIVSASIQLNFDFDFEAFMKPTCKRRKEFSLFRH